MLRNHLGVAEGDLDAFVRDCFAAELAALTGHGDFAKDLDDVLRKWNCGGRAQELLSAWEWIEVHHAVLDIVRELRAAGTTCCLATNQQPSRARYMSRTLGYREEFDHEFYSCEIGHMKPEPEYFEAILKTLALPPHRVLFIDDHEANVAAACALGLRGALFQPPAGSLRPAFMRDLLARHGLAPFRRLS